jgi:hypothetical protein
MKYIIKKLDSPPLSGDYDEILFDLPSPWRESSWNYVLFTTFNGQDWCGAFRARYGNNFLITKIDGKGITCIVSGGHGYIIDIDKKIKITDIKTDMIQDITVDNKSDSFIISTYWDIRRIDLDYNEHVLTMPEQADGINFKDLVGDKLNIEFTEIGASMIKNSKYYLDLNDWKIKKHVA